MSKGGFAGGAAGAVALLIATPFVMDWEGNELKTYHDPVGIPTACSGVTGPDIKMGKIYTQAECYELNGVAIMEHAEAVDRLITQPLTAKTKAAFISFTYNVGENALRKSTLRRKANAGDLRGACYELPKWVYAGGRKLRGLVRRREAEKELCLAGLSS